MKPDITIMIPSEHYDAFKEVITTGLSRAKIDPTVRKELESWWSVEREIIEEEIESSSE